MLMTSSIPTPLSNRSMTKKKRVSSSAVDVLDKISLEAKGLRSRIDAIVTKAEIQEAESKNAKAC